MTIVNNTVNDCAMTVLPDAPIDPATGLPVPTIAVATDGGVSVIKDDGNVYDSSATTVYEKIYFSQDDYLYALDTTFADDLQVFGYVGNVSVDGFTPEAVYWEQTTNAVKFSDDIVNNAAWAGDKISAAAQGVRPSLNLVYENRSAYTEGLAAYVSSTYNTGWMSGDIKGAFLSDTDDTDLVGGTDADRSVNANDLTVNGTVTRTPVATGADLVAYSGFSSSNYLEAPYNSDLDFGTGDFCVMGWVKNTSDGSNDYIFDRDDLASVGARLAIYISTTDFITAALAGTNLTFDTALPDGVFNHFAIARNSGTAYAFLNGAAAGSISATSNLDNSSAVVRLGVTAAGSQQLANGSLALLRISATAPTAEQIAKIYNDELPLFQENAQATLYGTSDAVTALAHDPVTDLLHVSTSDGRSDFQGLRRVSNTTDAHTSLSASNGLIVGGS